MKRLICILLLAALLCGCGSTAVPVADANGDGKLTCTLEIRCDVLMALLWAGGALPWAMGLAAWNYYPSLEGALLGPVQVLAYLSYGALTLLPLIIDLTEDHKWNSLRSRI